MLFCSPVVRSKAKIALPWLVGMVLLAAPAAEAMPIDFGYTGSLATFTVPQTGSYQIHAFGAQGGNYIGGFSGTIIGPGGLGAEIGGVFDLTAGEVLQIAVGGAGLNGIGGGGGGSFVVGPGNNPLVIAGGGGAGGVHLSFLTGGETQTGARGEGGLTGPDGGGATESPFPPYVYGTNGNGGASGSLGTGAGGGGGGGGFLSAGGSARDPVATGGAAWPDLAGGDPGGGFGGGGAGGPGGGGGYSGGAAGGFNPLAGCDPCSGQGGGSFDVGSDQILMADIQPGDGEVVITELSVSEPAPIALLGAGLLGLGVVRRRRGRAGQWAAPAALGSRGLRARFKKYSTTEKLSR
jgi:hypothetical protein